MMDAKKKHPAVKLKAGGAYTNVGTISGANYGVEIYGGLGTVVNSGSIAGNDGVILGNGGSVTNKTGGTITGASWGVYLKEGGSVNNAAGGTIQGSVQGYSGGVKVLGAKGAITNSGTIQSFNYKGMSSASIYLGDGGSITNSGAITGEIEFGASGGDTLTNSGIISLPGTDLGSAVINIAGNGADSVTNSGTIDGFIDFSGSGANTLTLQTGSVLNGSAVGSTTKGSTNALVLTGSGATNSGFSNFNTLTVKATGTWTFGSGGSFNATSVSTGTLALTNGLSTALTEAAAGTVTIASGVNLALNGASTISGAVAGLGALFENSGATTFASGAKLTVSNWWIDGSTANAIVGASLSYAQAFFAESGAILTLSGGALSLTGAATFFGATTAGLQSLTTNGNTSVSGLTVGNTNGFTVAGFLTELGEVTLGDAHGDASTLTIGKTGTWDISGDYGVNLGSSAALSIQNSGLFEKTGGFGVSAIAGAFVNNGVAEVTTNTLDFQAAVTGTGTDVIAGVTAILEFDSTVAATQTIDFLRPDGVLLLDSPTKFSGVLNGFDTIFTNDAVEMLGSWAVKGYAQTTAAEGTLTLTQGTQTASIAFDGSYSNTRFHAFTFGGQTIVTYI